MADPNDLMQMLLAPPPAADDQSAPVAAVPDAPTKLHPDDLTNLLLAPVSDAPAAVAATQSQTVVPPPTKAALPPPMPEPFYKRQAYEPQPYSPVGLGIRGATASLSDYPAALLAMGENRAERAAKNLYSDVMPDNAPDWAKPSPTPEINYNQALAMEGQAADEGAKNFPGIETAGAVLSPANKLAGSIPLLSSLPRYLQYGTVGTMLGGLFGGAGARSQEGGVPSASDVESGAKHGAEWGFGTAVGIPALAETGAGLYRMASKVPAALDSAGNALSDTAQSAMNRISQVFGRDNLVDETGASAAQAKSAQMGPEASLADLGPNASLEVNRAANKPGAALNIVDQAAKARGDVPYEITAESLAKNLADPNFADTLDTLRAQRSAVAQPLRAKALADSAGVPIESPLIQRLQGTPEFQSAMNTGRSIARMEGARTGFPIPQTEAWAYPDALGQTGGNMGAEAPVVPTLRMLDAVKQGYQTLLKPYRNPYTGELQNLDPWATEVAKTVEDFTTELRNASPTYAKYLDSWAEPSESMRAVNTGKAFAGMKPQEVGRIWNDRDEFTAPDGTVVPAKNGMTDAEQQFAKVGYAKALLDKAGGRGSPVQNIFGSQNQRQVAQMLFGDDFPAFENDMNRAGTISKNTQDWTSNSATVKRAIPDENQPSTLKNVWNIGKEGALGIYSGVKGDWPAAAMSGIRLKGAVQSLIGPNEGVSTEIARRLTSTDPAVKNETLDILNQIAATRAQRSALPGQVGAATSRIGVPAAIGAQNLPSQP